MEKPYAVTEERSSHGDGDSPVRPVRRRSRVVSFLRKWYWLLSIIVVCVLLVILLPLLLVGVPRRAQREVNQSWLEFQSIALTDPTPTSIHLRQEEILQSRSSRHPRLDGFNASLFLEDTLPDIKPFAYVNVPPVHSTGAVRIVIDQPLQIADMRQFTRYTAMVLGSEQYRLAIRGRTGLKQRGLRKITVDYNEVVTLKGLNRLQGLNVTEFRILARPESDGANLVGRVMIPNPSIMTMELGNVTMNLAVDGDPIGTALLPNLTLMPGDNMAEMRATLNQTAVMTKVAAYPDRILPFNITGNSAVYRGRNLPYYEIPLRASTIPARLNLASARRE